MTREEAIHFAECLKNNWTIDFNDMEEFCDMAIEALHREEAEEKGWCHRIRPKNVEVVVRCKDCKHYREVTTNYGICYERPNVITSQKADDFCSYGERKGGEENET